MSIEDVRNADDPLAGIEREVFADAIQAQRELLELESYFLRRLMFAQPASARLTFGAGNAAEQTLAGDQRDPFNGVAVLNPSTVAVGLGLEAGGGGANAPFVIPPRSFLVLPVRYVNVSIGLINTSDAAATAPQVVTVVRLRVPPIGVDAGPLQGGPDDMAGALTNGRAVVAAFGTPVALSAVSLPCRWVIVTAFPTNTQPIAVGGQGVVAAAAGLTGTPLNPGGSITIPVDNAAKVFIDSRVNGEGASFTVGA